MVRRPSFLIPVGTLLLVMSVSYNLNSKSPDAEPVTYPAANLKEDAFDPGDGWKLVWEDAFDGETLDAKNWNRQELAAGTFNKEWQAYTDSTENAYLEDGCLVIKAIHRSDHHGHDQYTSARLNTAGKQAWKYGKFAARIQLPHGEGMWPAFWILGANCNENGGDTPWPFCGEIDIFELYGSKDNAAVEANIHFANLSGEHEQINPPPHFDLPGGIFADKFHVFEIEWDEQEIIWKVDGQVYASVDISTEDKKEFHQEFFILLNIAVGGRWAGRPDASTLFPQMMYVDWVRVYQED